MDKNSAITVLLVDDNAHHNETIRTLLTMEPGFKFVGAEVTGEGGVFAAQHLQPDIVLMDINLPDIDGFEAARKIIKALPRTSVIMLSIQDNVSYFRKALTIRARGYLTKPVNPDELYETMRNAYADRDEPVTTPTEPARPKGNVIVVYSPQGGAGSTTIATNVASELLQQGSKVLLVDADLQYGDVSVLLNLPVERTMFDLLNSADDLDMEFFENVAITHSTGLKVLVGAKRLEDAIEMRDEHEKMVKIIEQTLREFDYVVVDTSSHLDNIVLALMDMASKIIVVTAPTLESLKNTRLLFDFFTEGDYPVDKLALVVNGMSDDRQRKQVIVASERIKSFLRRPLAAELPLDEMLVRQAVLKGLSLSAFDRKQEKPLTQSIIRLAEQLRREFAQV